VSRFLLDTNVVLYATGAAHRYREPCRHLVALAGAGDLRPEASVELVQEVLWVRSRRLGDRLQGLQDARDAGALCVLHPVETGDLDAALALFAAHPALTPRDALHAATALERGIRRIVSADRHFDGVAGLERVDPLDVAVVDALR
jgi:uncharacterized protein